MISTIAFTVLLAQEAFDLQLKVADNTQLNYNLKVEVKTEVGDEIKYDSDLVQKFLVVNEDRSSVMTSAQKNVKLFHMGQELPFSDPPATSMTFGPRGIVQNIAGDEIDSAHYRFQNLITIVVPENPVAVGDTWTATIPASEETGAVKTECTFSAVVVEDLLDRRCLKIRYEAKEATGAKPASATGTVWMDIATGTRVRAMSDMKDTPLGGLTVAAKWDMTLKP